MRVHAEFIGYGGDKRYVPVTICESFMSFLGGCTVDLRACVGEVWFRVLINWIMKYFGRCKVGA